ncbi:MAG: bis(5'-nucleosyl)-tetraphosphatase (symmetrical) YqeK [Eubacteriales bacterium]|nr:bis(5'-nucleosyl)-tetraphosphatase (symmetrical) YqeK [Eubacteriales bacterium]
MTTVEIKKDLRQILSEKRYEHTLGVEYTAACLAMRYGADMEKAKLAGLLHDCAKQLSTEDKLAYCEQYGLSVSEYEARNPELLHAKLGALFAKIRYGVDDPEILSAITWHTTGKPEMTLLDKILYIADFIEPNRDQAKNLPQVRKMAFDDIDDCLYRILEDSIVYLNGRNITVDPMTQITYESYKAIRKNQK